MQPFLTLLATGLLVAAFLFLSAVILRWRRVTTRPVEHREEWFSAVIEHGADLILVVADDGQLQYASPAVTRLLGYQPAEVVGWPGSSSAMPSAPAARSCWSGPTGSGCGSAPARICRPRSVPRWTGCRPTIC